MYILTKTDAKYNGVDNKQIEAVVLTDKRWRQTPHDEIGAEHGHTIDTAQISDEAYHDADHSVGDADDENKLSRLTGVETDLDLTEVREVDQRDDKRNVRQKVTDSKRHECEVG